MIVFDVQDQRKIGDAVKIRVDEDRLYKIAEAVGVPDDRLIEVKIRLRDAADGKPLAKTQPEGGSTYRIVLYLLPKATLSPKARGFINSALVHEMRHVAQFEDFGKIVVAMFPNDMEAEAQVYGEKASLKDLGKKVWAIGESK